MHESCLSIHLNQVCFYRFLSHYIEFRRRLPELYTVPAIIFYEQGRLINCLLGFLNQINVVNVEMFCFALKILRKCSLKAATVSFEHTRQIFVVRLQLMPNKC